MNLTQPCLNLVVIRSPEIDRAVTFYQILGLAFTLHSHGSGPEHYSSELNGLIFEIYPLTDENQATTSLRIGFQVANVDDCFESLIEIGATTVSRPKDSEWGRRAVVKDLDGHAVELLQPFSPV